MSKDELSAEQEAEVSRLLADAASPTRLPDEVAARLDEVLAALVSERTEDSDVVPLRSRRWPQLLVAAAAVSLVGYVGTNLVRDSESQSGTVAESALDGDSPSDNPGDSAGENDGHNGGQELSPVAPHDPKPAASRGPDWNDRQLDGSTGRAYARIARDTALDLAGRDGFRGLAESAKGKACLKPAAYAAAGTLYDVRLTKRARAFVLVQAINANAARVDLFSCRQPLLPHSTRFVLAAR